MSCDASVVRLCRSFTDRIWSETPGFLKLKLQQFPDGEECEVVILTLYLQVCSVTRRHFSLESGD